MRPLLLAVFLLLPGVLHAQYQESLMAERLLQPDRTLGNASQDKTYYGTGGTLDFSKTVDLKEFNFVQKFSAKAFDTKDFSARSFWNGDFQFSTKTASVKTAADATKVFSTKSATIKEARYANKSFITDKGSYDTRDADLDAKAKTSQQHLDDLYKGKAMNIDQVRDLLNKPRLVN